MTLSYNVSRSGPCWSDLHWNRKPVLDFDSANPSVVKSIKQRDLLNTWLRLFAREQDCRESMNFNPRGSRTNSEGSDVTHIAASLKTICEDGGFQIQNLMRGSDSCRCENFSPSSTAISPIAAPAAFRPTT